MNSSPSLLRKLILGKSPYILSHTEFKRALLTGQLALITFIFSGVYIVFDLTNSVATSWFFLSICAALAAISFYLNRRQFHFQAKIVLGIATNFTVFIFASSEPASTGLSALFISNCLGALAAFGYEERKWAFAFIILSIALGSVTLFADLRLIPYSAPSASYVMANLALNLLTATLSSVMILYFLINVNYHAEISLREREVLLVRKNEELTKINSELDRFVYSSSHDLKAPLASVMGLIQLVELSNEPAELKMYVNLMKSRVNDLEKFIKDIADFARNNSLKLEYQDVQLKKLVREVLESLQFYPGAEKIAVTLDIPESLIVSTDRTRLKMVISNLVSNSFKYSDTHKDVSFVRVYGSSEETKMRLTVEDNGIGIPEEAVAKVFEMFFQAHDKSKGSGLGLYIVKETVQKLGGHVQVESKVGAGSRFQIELPLTPAYA
ncbi:MAG: sensor histidine kinase [Bacteroidota bacterium]